MKIPPTLIPLLGLSAPERRLLTQLGGTPESTSTLARRARVPRTSALRALAALNRRGIAEQTRTSKRRRGWVAIEIDAFESSPAQPAQEGDIVVYRGRKELMELARMADSFESERIIWLRGSRVWEGYNKQQLRGRFIFMLRLFARKGVVLEEIASERAPGLDVRHGGPEVVASQKKLLRVLTLIPDKYLGNSYSDMMLFRDSVSFMNWYDEKAILVRDPDLVRFFKQILSYLGDTGERVKPE